jgi:outer membrane protein
MLNFRQAAVGLLCTAVMSLGTGLAQEAPKVFIFNQQNVLQSSQAAADLQSKMETLSAEAQEELASGGEELEKLQQDLEAARDVAGPERLQELQQNFRETAIEYAIQERIVEAELRRAQQRALGEIRQAIGSILESLAAERDIDLILPAEAVAFSSPSVDLTDEIISRLNNTKKAVNVERVTLTDEQKQQIRQAVLQQIQAQSARAVAQ